MNYDQCLKYARLINKEFPTLEINFPKKSNFLNFPPRNLFLFSKTINTSHSTFDEISIHFVTDGDLTNDNLILTTSTPNWISPRTLLLRQVYITFDQLPEVIHKLQDICPNKTFDNIFLNKCKTGVSQQHIDYWGQDLIEFIYMVSIYVYGVLSNGKSSLLILRINSDAFGVDLLNLIKELMINRLLNPTKSSNENINSEAPLFFNDQTQHHEAFGKDLVDFINSCNFKVMCDYKIYKDEVSAKFTHNF